MDCEALIKQIEHKYHIEVKTLEDSQDYDPALLAERSANFLAWFEDLINNGLVDVGEGTESAKKCILRTIENDPEGTVHPLVYDALSVFSDKRLKEMFGVEIFANLDEE
ncbi:MAG: hypothetical protein M1605_04235 [Candidatus Thermoplasmatota archaeon]|nr:hypothetical protein [Candidatus Thermoplasmatota archaeon]